MNASIAENMWQTKPYAIVVGIEFDLPGDHALREALRVGRVRGNAEIHVIHVVTDAPAHPLGAVAIDRTAARVEEAAKKLRAYIADQTAGIPEAHWLPITIHTRIGLPAEVIMQVAVDVDADVIVAGTHGRRGVRRLALGSIAGRLIEIARCPVLIARPKDFAGLERSAAAEPSCPDCSRTRSDSLGAQLWCAYHGASQIRQHTHALTERFLAGRPGTVPAT